MRAVTSIVLLASLAVFACGCDPGGLRRVQLRLPAAVTGHSSQIAVDSPDVQQAFLLLDSVICRHGYVPMPGTNGCIRLYVAKEVDANGRECDHHCRVWPTSTGLLVTFGEPGFLAADPGAEDLFVMVREALIKKYGKRTSRATDLGGLNPQGGANGKQLLSSELPRAA